MNPQPADPDRSGNHESAGWIHHPGRGGAFGALMDEMARAAEDFARIAESVPKPAYGEERPSDDPDTVSLHAVCAHVVGAVYRHTNYIRRVRGMDLIDPLPRELHDPATPAAVRSLLHEALLYMEAGLEGLVDLPEATVAAMTFPARWGPTYDPEMMMEHAVVHLLRHRRQITRWPGASWPAQPGVERE